MKERKSKQELKRWEKDYKACKFPKHQKSLDFCGLKISIEIFKFKGKSSSTETNK